LQRSSDSIGHDPAHLTVTSVIGSLRRRLAPVRSAMCGRYVSVARMAELIEPLGEQADQTLQLVPA
jgi:hypothetical protein